MKRKNLVSIHMVATAVATVTILIFFTLSLATELHGDEELIKSVKTAILRALPILLFAMPALAISGNKLAGASRSVLVRQKQQRMKMTMINGIILASLAVFLYYRANYQTIDNVFLYAQVAELFFGLFNLILIGLNIKAGLKLSGRMGKMA